MAAQHLACAFAAERLASEAASQNKSQHPFIATAAHHLGTSMASHHIAEAMASQTHAAGVVAPANVNSPQREALSPAELSVAIRGLRSRSPCPDKSPEGMSSTRHLLWVAWMHACMHASPEGIARGICCGWSQTVIGPTNLGPYVIPHAHQTWPPCDLRLVGARHVTEHSIMTSSKGACASVMAVRSPSTTRNVITRGCLCLTTTCMLQLAARPAGPLCGLEWCTHTCACTCMHIRMHAYVLHLSQLLQRVHRRP